MSAHTPGPWKVRRWSWPTTVEGSIHQVISADNFPTAFVPAWDKPLPGEVEAGEEAKANARLIAAAPELLAALQQSVALADANAARDFGGKPIRTEPCAAVYAACVAAIAKATGSA